MTKPAPSAAGVLVALLYLMAVAAPASAQSAPLAPTSVREFVDPDERISGGAVVGIAFVTPSDRINPALLYAFLDEQPSGELTLEFNGIDGRYAIRATYDDSGLANGVGVVALQLGQLSYDKLLDKYSSDNAAVLLSDAAGRRYLVRWGSAERAPEVRVYLNAERAEAFFFAQTTEGRKMVMCRTPSSPTPPFKFNRICDVPAEQLAAGPVQIQRRFGSRRMEPITLVVAGHVAH